MRPTGISESMTTPTGVADVHLIMVGSDGANGGRPVAVVPEASAIPRPARQNLAARVGVADTVFFDGAVGDMLSVSAFHPSRVAHGSGPAYIAAAWFHWARQRAPLRPVRCRTPAGIVPVGLAADGVLGLRFPVAEIATPEPTPAYQAALSSTNGALGVQTAIADNGIRFLLLWADGASALDGIDSTKGPLADYCAEARLQGICAVHPDDTGETVYDGTEGRSVILRCLSPTLDASVDPATSIASVAACAQWLSGMATEKTDEASDCDVLAVRQDPSTANEHPFHLRADIRREAGGSAPTAIDVGGYCHHAGETSFSW